MNYEKLLRDRFEIVDEGSLREYLELISVGYDGVEYSENHHILPRSLYPEYVSEPDNIIRLRFTDHIKAHELLFRFTRHSSMFNAYNFMKGRDISTNVLFEMGYTNISQLPDVREKISISKTGKPRKDLIGSSYFGADEESIRNGISKMADKIKGTLIVKDEFGNKFRVSVNDERYKSGEYVSFNKGVDSPNNAMKNKDNVAKFLNSRNKNDDVKKTWSKDQLLTYLINSHKEGKKVLGAVDFNRNFVRIINLTSFDRTEIHKEFVQRLSKG